MILPIYTYGQPVLRKVSQDIDADYPELDTLIANMVETLADSEGIGLAAPQIGLNIRLVIIDLDVISDDLPEYKDYKRVFINPHIIEYDDTSTSSIVFPKYQPANSIIFTFLFLIVYSKIQFFSTIKPKL